MTISSRVRRIAMSPTLRVAALARELEAAGRDIIDLSAGQPDFPTPPHVVGAGHDALDAGKTGYTANAGIVELRDAIRADVARTHGATYDAEEVLVSPGAKASLFFAMMTLVDDGDEVLLPTPYWVSYTEQIGLFGGRVVTVPCDESAGFALDPATLEARIGPRTRLLVLNYPSNPTGACFDADELRAIAEVCLRHDLWVIADEIYSGLVFDDRPFVGIVGAEPRMRDRTVIVDGMSKTYSMTGWRIGYALGPREVVKAMSRAQSHATSNATSISQWASLAAVNGEREWLHERVDAFRARRDRVVDRLRAIDGIGCVRPRGAFYAFPNVASRFTTEVDCGAALAEYLLERAGVAVVPGEAFGSPEHVRISYADSLERIDEALARVEAAMRDLG